VTVELADGRLVVAVADDGSGFEGAAAGGTAAPVDRRAGSGLARLTERLEIVGGALAVSSRPGRGTRVEAHVPVRALAD
jgi:signal transduction histidine kinase